MVPRRPLSNREAAAAGVVAALAAFGVLSGGAVVILRVAGVL